MVESSSQSSSDDGEVGFSSESNKSQGNRPEIPPYRGIRQTAADVKNE
jgi:hypothetical protein